MELQKKHNKLGDCANLILPADRTLKENQVVPNTEWWLVMLLTFDFKYSRTNKGLTM